MTIKEANAVMALLRWALKQPCPDEHVREAALHLSEKAYHKLMAGLAPEDVRAVWGAEENFPT